jgi:hypothetical protein
MSRIIVQMGGGLIRDVFKTGKGDPKEVVVVDLEAEQDEIDSDPDRAVRYKDKEGKISCAIIQDYGFSKLPENCDVIRSIEVWKKNCKKEAKHD